MTTLNKRTAPNVTARKRLLDYISGLPKGASRQLPPERELCEKLDLNRGTMKKALRLLSQEGRVVIVPRKGNFICDLPPSFKIAVILWDVVPKLAHLRSADIMAGVLSALRRSPCAIHMVQASKAKEIPALIESFNFDGAIWYNLDLPLTPAFKEAVFKMPTPSVFISGSSSSELPPKETPPGLFSIDCSREAETRFEFLRSKGCKRVGSVSISAMRPESFKKAAPSVDPSLLFSYDDALDALPSALDSGALDGLALFGGPREQNLILELLDSHPAGASVKVVLDFGGLSFAELKARHPRVNFAAFSSSPNEKLGFLAASALMSKLRDGAEIVPETLLPELTEVDGDGL